MRLLLSQNLSLSLLCILLLFFFWPLSSSEVRVIIFLSRSYFSFRGSTDFLLSRIP